MKMQSQPARLSTIEKKKMALEIALKAGGKPIQVEALMRNAKQIFAWLKR